MPSADPGHGRSARVEKIMSQQGRHVRARVAKIKSDIRLSEEDKALSASMRPFRQDFPSEKVESFVRFNSVGAK